MFDPFILGNLHIGFFQQERHTFNRCPGFYLEHSKRHGFVFDDIFEHRRVQDFIVLHIQIFQFIRINIFTAVQNDNLFLASLGISGYILGVNPFDQPGVEAYKKNMFALLGKPGYEEQAEALRARL